MERLRAVVRWTREVSIVWCYLAAAALIALATVLRLLLGPGYEAYPYVTYMPAVLLVALVFDRGSGIFAGVLAVVAVVWLFVEAPLELSLDNADFVAVLLFLTTAILITLLGEVVRSLADHLDALEDQREVLLRELTHRTRNDLQVLSNALALEGMRVDDPGSRARLAAMAERVKTVAHIHERLAVPGDPRQRVMIKQFMEDLCGHLARSLGGQVAISCEAEPLPVRGDLAAAMGIMVNELVTNALKHAALSERDGRVQVQLGRQPGGGLMLSVADNGPGCAPAGGEGSGLQLIASLAQRYGGAIVREDAQPGCRIVVRVPRGRWRAAAST